MEAQAIPSLLTNYPQVVTYSVDEVRCIRSGFSVLSRGEGEKNGSIASRKRVWRMVLPSRSKWPSPSVLGRMEYQGLVLGPIPLRPDHLCGDISSHPYDDPSGLMAILSVVVKGET
jgi:hypothetical protein